MSVNQARRLRQSTTPAEKKLWLHLRNRKLAGLKFRRQHPIGDRVADFYCEEAKLAIELDGSGHDRHFGETVDLDRAIDLYEHGVRILRFSNQAVITQIEGVLSVIIDAVAPEDSFVAPDFAGDKRA